MTDSLFGEEQFASVPPDYVQIFLKENPKTLWWNRLIKARFRCKTAHRYYSLNGAKMHIVRETQVYWVYTDTELSLAHILMQDTLPIFDPPDVYTLPLADFDATFQTLPAWETRLYQQQDEQTMQASEQTITPPSGELPCKA